MSVALSLRGWKGSSMSTPLHPDVSRGDAGGKGEAVARTQPQDIPKTHNPQLTSGKGRGRAPPAASSPFRDPLMDRTNDLLTLLRVLAEPKVHLDSVPNPSVALMQRTNPKPDKTRGLVKTSSLAGK